MFFEILELCKNIKDGYDISDDDARPSIIVLDEFKRTVIRTYTYLGKAPISPKIIFDGKGGILTSWVMPSNKFVKFYITPSAKGDTCETELNFDLGDTGGHEECVNYKRLLEILKRLN